MKRHKNSRHKGNLIHIAKNVTNSDALHSEKAMKSALLRMFLRERNILENQGRCQEKRVQNFVLAKQLFPRKRPFVLFSEGGNVCINDTLI